MAERQEKSDESKGQKSGQTRPARPSEQAVQTFGDSYRRERSATPPSDEQSDNKPERVIHADEEYYS